MQYLTPLNPDYPTITEDNLDFISRITDHQSNMQKVYYIYAEVCERDGNLIPDISDILEMVYSYNSYIIESLTTIPNNIDWEYSESCSNPYDEYLLANDESYVMDILIDLGLSFKISDQLYGTMRLYDLLEDHTIYLNDAQNTLVMRLLDCEYLNIQNMLLVRKDDLTCIV